MGLTIHFFLCAIGLIALFHVALGFWGINIPLMSLNFGTYPHIVFNRTKPLDLIFHVGGVALLTLYFISVGYWVHKNTKLTSHSRLKNLWLLSVGAFNLGILQWQPEKPVELGEWARFLAIVIVWLSITYAPLYALQIKRCLSAIDWRKQWNPANTGKIYTIFLFIAICQLAWTMAPFTMQRLQLLNEYLEVPTTTVFYEPKHEVPNDAYFDEHQLLGIALRYSPERDQGNNPPISDAVCITLEHELGISAFLADEKNNMGFAFNRGAKRLCAVDVATPEQWLWLRSLQPGEKGKEKVDDWFASVKKAEAQLRGKALDNDEKQFLRVNRFSLGFQYAGNGVIHHHGFMLNPLNEYDLGKPQDRIFAQYGWLNLYLTRWLLNITGGMSLQNYFKIWYAYYYLYYLLYFGLLWILFRRQGYVAAGALMSVGLLGFIDFQWLLEPPGINPIRRILELPLIAGLFLYWHSLRRRYLIAVFLSLWLYILNNWQFGLMALSVTGFVFVIWRWQHKAAWGRIHDCFALLGFVGGALLVSWMRGSVDPVTAYYLSGVASMPVSQWLGVGCLILFSLAAAVLLMLFDAKNPRAFLCLFLLLYTSAVMTYSLWNGSVTYLLIPGPLYVLLVLSYIRYGCERMEFLGHCDRIITGILFAVGVAMLISGGWNQEKTRDEFLGLMATHKTFEWNLDRAALTSTMDPKYFEEGVALIKRYSLGPHIYIVSKYDNFLPFLARRYSAMPFFEVNSFLATPRDTQACIERIVSDQPDVLFVDTDIQRDYTVDIVHKAAPFNGLHNVSRHHVAQMRTMQKIFFAVKDDYELVEKGLLLSVYKRKTAH